MPELQQRVAAAVRKFWASRRAQHRKQNKTGKRDQGSRGAVTGGAQMDGFTALIEELLVDSGIPESAIFRKRSVELPGFFRPTKEWDLIVVVNGELLASIEFKSQVGSFGNNFNNRTEEAIGTAHDLWTTYREGAFRESARPWLGYLMLLESAPASTRPVKIAEPHFAALIEFRDSSYAKRYELFCRKLVRERLYDAACLLLSNTKQGRHGGYDEPVQELGFANFAASLTARAASYARLKNPTR